MCSAPSLREKLIQEVRKLDPELRFQVRYGINTGNAIVGNFGSDERMDYTILGHAVNLSSKICQAADPDQILIGQIFDQIQGENLFEVHKVGSRALKGLKGKLRLFEVTDFLSSSPNEVVTG